MSYSPLWDGATIDLALVDGSNDNVDVTQGALGRTGTTPVAGFDVTGLDVRYDATDNPTPQRAGFILYNNSSQTLTLKHQSTASTARNRIIGLAPAGTASDVTVLAGQVAALHYDAIAQRWKVVSVG